jgi:hypothetical protein
MHFRRQPEIENIDTSNISTNTLAFFTLMLAESLAGHILIFKKVSDQYVAIGKFFQIDIDNLIQSSDGTVLLTDGKYSFVGSASIISRCVFDDRLFLESTECIDTIDVNESYKFHYHQIYDRIIQPKEVTGSAAIVRAYNTKASNCLVPIIVDAKGREIISAFREKKFVTPILHVQSLRLEHARTLGKMTEDGCQLRFELVQGNTCIAYKIFPVKMCNSFHALKNVKARLQRGGSSILGIGFHSSFVEDEWNYLLYE